MKDFLKPKNIVFVFLVIFFLTNLYSAPPSVPNLYVPSTATWTNINTIDWSTSTAPTNDVVFYDLQIGNSEDISTIIASSYTIYRSSCLVSDLNGNLTQGTKYWWHVRASTSTTGEYSAYSSTRSFKLDTTDAVFSNPQVKTSTGGWAANNAYVNVSTPQIQVSVQDTNSGLRVGMTETIASSGCVGLWHLNGNAVDSSGYGNDGTINSAQWDSITTWKTTGGSENMLFFDGSGDYVNCGNAASFGNLVNKITISLWSYQITAQGGTIKIAVGRSSDWEFGDCGNGTDWGFYSSALSGGGWVSGGVVTTRNAWHHMVFTYDGAAGRIYKDGVLAVEKARVGNLNVTANILIGQLGSSNFYFDGYLDEVGIWDRALSPEEIAVMYNSCAIKYSTNAWTNSEIITSTSTEPIVRTTGNDGTTALQVSTATAIQFKHGTNNRIQFLTRDEAGNLAESVSYTINVDTVPPSAITSLSGLANGSNINLSWISPGTDGITGAIDNGQFLIRRATWSVTPSLWGTGYDSKPSVIAQEITIDTGTTSSLPALSLCSTTFSDLDNNATHYFRIWTRDTAGNWSSLSTNGCTVYILSPPTLYYPSTTTWTNANICDWSDVPGTIGYYLEIDDDINFGSPVGGFGDVTTSSAAITSLSENTKYYWRVKTKYSANNYGAWSSTRSFKLDTTDAVFSNPQVKTSTGGWTANTAYVNVSTPQIQVSVQDTNSGLRVGMTETIASSGCVLLMHLNGNTLDSSGYRNDGTITGNPEWKNISSWKSESNTESMLYFDGFNNEYVNCGNGSGLNELTNSMSISIWVKWIRSIWEVQQIAVGRTGGGGWRFGAGTNSLNWGFYGNGTYGGGGTWAPDPVVPVSQNVWHHMVYTYDGDTAKIYKDGLLAAQKSVSGALLATDNIYIGAIQPTTFYFGGFIDEVGIWKRALSAEEIAVMYNSCAIKYSTNAWTNSTIIVSTLTEPTVRTTGSDGTTTLQISTATAIQFIHGTDNRIQFLALDEAGNLAESVSYTINVDTIVPSAITSLTGLVSGSNINLSWISPGTDGTIGAIDNGQFLIRRATWSVTPESMWGYGYDTKPTVIAQQITIDVGTPSSLPALSQCTTTFYNLSSATHYFRIWTRDTAGNWSSISNGCTVYLIAPPANFKGVALSTYSIQWSWDDVAGESGYRVRYSTSSSPSATAASPSLSANTINWTESGLMANTSYYRVVVSTDSQGESALSNTATTYTLASPPIAPIVFSNVGPSSATLTWTANTDNPAWTRYGVITSISSDFAGTSVSTIVSFANNLTDTTTSAPSLTSDTTYYFRVIAYNEDQISTTYIQSSTITKHGSPPAAPAITVILPNTQTTIKSGDKLILSGTAEASSTLYSITVKDLDGNTLAEWLDPAKLTSNTKNGITLESAIESSGNITANITIGNITAKYPMLRGITVEIIVQDNARKSQPGTSQPILLSAETNKITLYNNLFNPTKGDKTTIRYETTRPGRITIKVYTLHGNKVTTLVDETTTSTVPYWATWDGKDDNGDFVASGIYLIYIKGPGLKDTKKVCVIK
ncbi:MAG: hypothetical protein PHE88_10520 [Elusimicrobia bacterium]|nr:hypothetical protein [Elusimicrobiota bacterium]